MFGSDVDSERAFDKIAPVDRTRVRRRRLALGVTGALLAGVWAGPVAQAVSGARELESVSRTSYVVREGDTLWSIAKRLDPGEDPRPLVDAISAANRVQAGALVPGQTLLIPAGV